MKRNRWTLPLAACAVVAVLGTTAFFAVPCLRGGDGGGRIAGDYPMAFEPPDRLSYRGGIVIELQGNSWSTSLASRSIQGTDAYTRQAYKFAAVREAQEFHYLLAGLPLEAYDLELSFVEYRASGPGERVFEVSCNGSSLPGLSSLDVFAAVGRDRACQFVLPGVAAPEGMMDLRFKAGSGLAMVSHIRLISQGKTALEIDVTESRHWTQIPLRFVGGEECDVFEAVLSRFGSRFMVNPMPQLLAWRQSPLGTWTEDVSEFVLAFRDLDGETRCLPFTGRYPVFSRIDQNLTLTGIEYRCEDPSLPFQVRVTLKSPFYPEDVKLSTAPFFYHDIEVSNPGDFLVQGELLLARPHKDDLFGAGAPQALEGRYRGYRFASRYTYGEESHVIEACHSECFDFWEALAVEDGVDVDLHYADISDTSWLWDSPAGYPLINEKPLYTFVPRGYSGLDRSFSLPAGGSDRMTVVLACHDTGGVLEVLGDTDFRFHYGNPAGADLASVEEVVAYALGSERTVIEEKTAFFDGILSEEYLSPFPQAGRNLAACAFQNFICNTWWVHNASGREWFSVWEGIPYLYHCSVDVEFGNAWFYLCFWPDRLETILREYRLFEKEAPQGKYLVHDMGIEHYVTDMAYPHDMPVEENADYILLLYGYWKATGNTPFVREELSRVRDFTRFILRCDTDGDGLPDLYSSNTIDQSSPALQHSRNQTYLGVKAMAACRAAAEMARTQDPPDEDFASECEARVQLINLTLEQKLWRGDHFAVCLDSSFPAAECDAYSIYASNGLLWLLASGLDAGLTPSNLERFRIDLASAASATSRRYGCVHASVNNESQWVSQNLWRDALGYWLGVQGWAEGQEGRLAAYWDLERYYATRKSGGFWDVCAYNPGRPSREGVIMGAFLPMYAYDQSLGYYSRGTDIFSLAGALGRLRLDRVSDRLLYDPAHSPCRIPVLACADWGASDPARRIPFLVFGADGKLREAINSHLLPPLSAASSE